MTMVRKLIDILLVLMILAFAAYIVYTRFLYSPKPAKAISKITTANDILKYKTKVPPEIINTTLTSAACTNFLKISTEQSMMDYANEFIDHHVAAILKTCAGAFPSALQEKIDRAVFACKDSTREKISNACFGALLDAKNKSVETIIKPDLDPRDLNSTILLHLISVKFTNGNFLENPVQSLAIINALIDKEPAYLGGYKAKMMLLSMSNLNKEEHYKNEFEDTLEQARRLKPDDRELLELEIVQAGGVFTPGEEKKESASFKKWLEEESAKHPREGLYDYYRAQAIYENGNGNYEQALALVEKAFSKNPTDLRIKQTIENLKSNDDQKRKHPFSLSVGFSLNDL